METTGREAPSDLLEAYGRVRTTTERLASVLSGEDQTVQTMPDVSPTKWHRAHVTWFFETFVLGEYANDYRAFDDAYAYIFNSYYEAVGARHPRPERGFLSRPGIEEIARVSRLRRRRNGGAAPRSRSARASGADHPGTPPRAAASGAAAHGHQARPLPESRFTRPTWPVSPAVPGIHPPKAGWIEHDGGPVEIGHRGEGFGFDNEFPVHTVHLTPFGLADRPVTCGEWLSFMEDDGYRRPEFWLSDGWAVVNAEHWDAPLYWWRDPDDPERWLQFTLSGPRPVDPDEPVCHVSYYEADAFAHWTGMRLPTESEWETIAASHGEGDNFLRDDFLSVGAPHPQAAVSTQCHVRRHVGVDLERLCALPRVPGRPRRGGRVQRQVHGEPVRAPRRMLRHAGRTRPRHVPQLLPTRCPVVLRRGSAGQGSLSRGLHD